MIAYMVRRLLYMIPTLLLISIIAFFVIDLPEGDYLSNMIYQMQQEGDEMSLQRAERLIDRYALDDPFITRYWNWISGWVRGDFGIAFRYNKPVSEVIWERFSLTVIISISTLLFTYIVAIPIGVYSATHQYTMGDYFFTFIGFLGLSIPNFLLALILAVITAYIFGQPVGGLFSAEYAEASWSFGKVIDLLKHLWVPVIVVGTAGTAGLIRIMRSNLLDILGQEYIMTARSKGLKENIVIYKHAVRVAINPIVSLFGMQFPRIVSGTTITAIVLSLPTIGPMLFESLLARDMFLAGTVIMLLAIFLQIGNLVADFMLSVVDPRIRYD